MQLLSAIKMHGKGVIIVTADEKRELLAQCNAAIKWYEKLSKVEPNSKHAKEQLEYYKKQKKEIENEKTL